jgi:DNA-binding transcriptional LysR family regulator
MPGERPETNAPGARLRGADLPLLVSLDMLLEECNVTRAAARLHLSQPALSAQLSRLRRLFGDPLLIPSANGRGLVRSPFAARLQRRLRPALTALSEALHADEFRPERSTRCFNIAATGAAAAMVVPALIARIRAAGCKDLRFVTATLDQAKLAFQLERGEVDLCLGPACMLPPGLRSVELLDTPHVLVQRRGHPRSMAPVAIAEYCAALEHANVGGLHGYLDEQLYRQGHTRHVGIALRDFSLVPPLLRSSDLVCTLPEKLAKVLDGSLERVELGFFMPSYVLCMAWHARSEEDPGVAWLRGEAAAAVAA